MLKDILTFLIMPFSVTLILIGAGLLFLWFRKKRKGMALVITGTMLLYFFSSWFGSWLLLNPLESRYEPLTNPVNHPSQNVVVLSGGHEDNTQIPATLQIGTSSMYRLLEGVRIHRQLPGSRLILLGGVAQEHSYTSEILHQLMEETGMRTNNVTFADGAGNTEEEAELIADLLGEGSDLILVTSARHMTRSMLLFKAQGLNPIAAPTQLQIRGNTKHFPVALLWSPDYLSRSHKAIYEYAGITWAWIRGKL